MDFARPWCLHCGRRKALVGWGHRRGLCRACRLDPAIRLLYPLPGGDLRRAARLGAGAGDCRNCVGRKAQKWKRGLCWACYRDPAVRERFPLGDSRYSRRGVADGHAARPLPEPTAHPPGTPEKLAVLHERARLGQQLFHPDDAGMTGLARVLAFGRPPGPRPPPPPPPR